MLIKVGDKVEVKRSGLILRDGIITNISIATHLNDPAGEDGKVVESYDTELEYAGSISYTDVTFNDEGDETGEEYWAYFAQIKGA